MEEIVALVLLFGGGTVVALCFSPIGRAIAERIRGRPSGGDSEAGALREDVLSELDGVRREISELQERVDFAERLLARQKQDTALPSPHDRRDRPVQS